MSAVVVGDTRPVVGKKCRSCDCVGEWPGQPCPECKETQNGFAKPEAAPDTKPFVEPAPDRLGELAKIANDEHAQIVRRGHELIDHAITCGHALLEARKTVERGGWLDWMERNLQMHITTAYRYMRLAEYEKEVRASAVESIEHAITLLADRPRRGHGPRGYSDADKAEWIKLVDEVGVKRAAKALGISVGTVWTWASPNSPQRQREGVEPAPKRSKEITDEAIERVALWLVDRFGDSGYHVRVTDQVRSDALEILNLALEPA